MTPPSWDLGPHWRVRLRRMVESTDTRSGRAFDFSVQGLVIVSLVSFTISTQPHLSDRVVTLLRAIEYVTAGLFTFEYALRLAVARHATKYVFSFYGLVDLLAIAPFYFATGFDARALRAVRLLRVFRLLKLARYNRAIGRYQKALHLVREELVLFSAATAILIYLSAVGIYFFEHDAQPGAFASVFDSLWWAVITLTTVGYGDVYPVTAGGRVFTVIVLLIGLGIVAVPTGLFASALSRVRDDEPPRG